jgi:two-component sensor histidine kinase
VHEAQERTPQSENPTSGQGTARQRELEAFRASLVAGPCGLWFWDLRSKQLTWSTHMDGVQPPAGLVSNGICSIDPQDLPSENGSDAFSALRRTLQTLEPCRVEYRVSEPTDRNERWFEASVSAIVKDGAAVQLLGMWREVTERLRVHREVKVRARQQEVLARLGERALVESDLQKFFNEVAASVGEILDVELVKILELVPGDAELVLRAGIGWESDLIGKATVSTGRESQAGYTLASGRPVITEDLRAETRFTGHRLLHDHGVVSGMTAPIAGRDGRAYGVLGTHTPRHRKFHDYDISFLAAVANVVAGAIQRRQLDQRHELMIRELRHRSGNLFSQLLALFAQTAKTSRSLGDLVTKYEARVLALANAHRLITEGGWKSTSLHELLNTLLAPFLDRVSFKGPNVFLEPDPTFGLSMAIHELATNASKHGSLSAAAGRVELTWLVTRTAQGLTLVLNWNESRGPAPRRTRRQGFGARLINMVIERQLNGQVQQVYESGGLQTKLTVPLTHERWPGAARSASHDMPA